MLFQCAGHFIEGLAQLTDLILSADGTAHRQIAVGKLAGYPGQMRQSPGQRETNDQPYHGDDTHANDSNTDTQVQGPAVQVSSAAL